MQQLQNCSGEFFEEYACHKHHILSNFLISILIDSSFELHSSPISKDARDLHCCNFLRKHSKSNEIKVSGQKSFCIFLIFIVKMRQIDVKNGTKNIQAAAYNGARTVPKK